MHLLPFFHPIDGADAGFDPADHTEVDSRLGDWNDLRALGETHELVAASGPEMNQPTRGLMSCDARRVFVQTALACYKSFTLV